MELKQFTYVRQVAESGSFTKAAAELFISQPALSNYVSKVEEDLGVKLFDRSANPLKLTYAGEQYVKRAKAILGQMEEMNRELRDITHHMTGRLRIGFPSERIVYMLPLLLKPLKDRYPGIDVEVSTGPGNQLIADLKAGNVDFVFLPYWTPLKDIVQVEVSQEELVLVAAKEYLNESCFLDRGKKIINWKEAAKLPLITLKKGHALRSSVDVLYANAEVKPNIFFESHSNMLSYRLAAQGLGVAIIPEMEAKKPVRWDWLLHSPVKFSIDEQTCKLVTRNEEKQFTSVAQLFSRQDCKITQTDRFVVPPNQENAVRGEVFTNSWHLTASFTPGKRNRILTIIQVQPDGKQAVGIQRDGNLFQCGDWTIEAELDVKKPASLYITNKNNQAVFGYGKSSLLINGKSYRPIDKTASLLFDKIDGSWQMQERMDRKPQLTGSNR